MINEVHKTYVPDFFFIRTVGAACSDFVSENDFRYTDHSAKLYAC